MRWLLTNDQLFRSEEGALTIASKLAEGVEAVATLHTVVSVYLVND